MADSTLHEMKLSSPSLCVQACCMEEIKLDSRIWYLRVPSMSNCADDPSRLIFWEKKFGRFDVARDEFIQPSTLQELHLNSWSWYSTVASKSNCADGPSRKIWSTWIANRKINNFVDSNPALLASLRGTSDGGSCQNIIKACCSGEDSLNSWIWYSRVPTKLR